MEGLRGGRGCGRWEVGGVRRGGKGWLVGSGWFWLVGWLVFVGWAAGWGGGSLGRTGRFWLVSRWGGKGGGR